MQEQLPLKDPFGRVHDYLRISLTDTCNLRCFYCMPDEQMKFMPSDRLMSAGEIESIAQTFVQHGVNKIRLTGGEPLVRKDAGDILIRLSKLPVELTLTTNGVFLHDFIPILEECGVRSINISLDTLDPEKFKRITARDRFQQVWQNIQALVKTSMHVKLNVVAIGGINDNEINDFVALTQYLPLHVRFIEFMPFAGNNWMSGKVLSMDEMLQTIGTQFIIEPLENQPHDTAKKFRVPGHAGTFAFISTMSSPFCSGCNRLRLTADGKMKNCLFSKGETDLLGALRNGESLEELIRQSLKEKAWERGGQIPALFEQTNTEALVNRSMISIGG